MWNKNVIATYDDFYEALMGEEGAEVKENTRIIQSRLAGDPESQQAALDFIVGRVSLESMLKILNDREGKISDDEWHKKYTANRKKNE